MRICTELKRPRFEVEQFPASELEWWSLVFSIRDNGDKPIIEQADVSVEQSKADFRRMMSGGVH